MGPEELDPLCFVNNIIGTRKTQVKELLSIQNVINKFRSDRVMHQSLFSVRLVYYHATIAVNQHHEINL